MVRRRNRWRAGFLLSWVLVAGSLFVGNAVFFPCGWEKLAAGVWGWRIRRTTDPSYWRRRSWHVLGDGLLSHSLTKDLGLRGSSCYRGVEIFVR